MADDVTRQEGAETEAPSPALPYHQPPPCAISRSVRVRVAMPRRPVRPTPARSTPPPGSISPTGVAVNATDPQIVGLYITACAFGAESVGGRNTAVSTIERRLLALVWAYTQRGLALDRRDRHIATVLASIRNSHAAPPR